MPAPSPAIDTDGYDPEDWVTLWQSELAALAVDREAHERLADVALAWSTTLERLGPGHDGPAGRPGPDAPAGSPAVDAGADPRDQQIEQLRARIAELQRAAPDA